jgi:hypothetical protein
VDARDVPKRTENSMKELKGHQEGNPATTTGIEVFVIKGTSAETRAAHLQTVISSD